ncbi:MAG: pyruvate dehydrogenase (acetyl-transferring) E1 component subunit alpha [Halobacteriales archaeon]
MSASETGGGDPVQVLDPDGQVRDGATVPDLADEELLRMYRELYFARRFDRRAVNLNRRGEMGSFPPLYGHEAAQIASAMALSPDDWIVPSYRDHGALITHGFPAAGILRYYMGQEAGNVPPPDSNIFPINGSVASQIPHATGLAWASKLRQGSPPGVLCYFGDGATSEGDFHEGLNFAGVFDTPTVFFCQNNQWAISMPRERQTAAATLAQKARAYGFDGLQVDGMDPLAVYKVTRAALEQAKNPADDQCRPSLIEAVLYRFGAHSTADDPQQYRDGVPKEWQRKDPVPRFEAFLRGTGRLDEESLSTIQDEVEGRLEDVIETALTADRPDPLTMFEAPFEQPPEQVRRQAERHREFIDKYGVETFSGGD